MRDVTIYEHYMPKKSLEAKMEPPDMIKCTEAVFDDAIKAMEMKALVDTVASLQNAMLLEQAHFNALSQELATLSDHTAPRYREISDELFMSQTRMSMLCARNMKCFAKQATSYNDKLSVGVASSTSSSSPRSPAVHSGSSPAPPTALPHQGQTSSPGVSLTARQQASSASSVTSDSTQEAEESAESSSMQTRTHAPRVPWIVTKPRPTVDIEFDDVRPAIPAKPDNVYHPKQHFAKKNEVVHTRKPRTEFVYQSKPKIQVVNPSKSSVKTEVLSQTKVTYKVVNPSSKAEVVPPTKTENKTELNPAEKISALFSNSKTSGSGYHLVAKPHTKRISHTNNMHISEKTKEQPENSVTVKRIKPGNVTKYSALFESRNSDASTHSKSNNEGAKVNQENDPTTHRLLSREDNRFADNSDNGKDLSPSPEHKDNLSAAKQLSVYDSNLGNRVWQSESIPKTNGDQSVFTLLNDDNCERKIDADPNKIVNGFVNQSQADLVSSSVSCEKFPLQTTRSEACLVPSETDVMSGSSQGDNVDYVSSKFYASMYSSELLDNKEFGKIPTRRPVEDDMFADGWVSVGQVEVKEAEELVDEVVEKETEEKEKQSEPDGDELSINSGTSEDSHHKARFSSGSCKGESGYNSNDAISPTPETKSDTDFSSASNYSGDRSKTVILNSADDVPCSVIDEPAVPCTVIDEPDDEDVESTSVTSETANSLPSKVEYFDNSADQQATEVEEDFPVHRSRVGQYVGIRLVEPGEEVSENEDDDYYYERNQNSNGPEVMLRIGGVTTTAIDMDAGESSTDDYDEEVEIYREPPMHSGMDSMESARMRPLEVVTEENEDMLSGPSTPDKMWVNGTKDEPSPLQNGHANGAEEAIATEDAESIDSQSDIPRTTIDVFNNAKEVFQNAEKNGTSEPPVPSQQSTVYLTSPVKQAGIVNPVAKPRHHKRQAPLPPGVEKQNEFTTNPVPMIVVDATEDIDDVPEPRPLSLATKKFSASMDELVEERPNMKYWDPTTLLEKLYKLEQPQEINFDTDQETPRYIPMEGYMEKLPLGSKKSTFWKSWKRRYFRAKDGYLYYYEGGNKTQPAGVMKLSGGAIEDMGTDMLGIDDGRGRFLVVRCLNTKDTHLWKLSLKSQVIENRQEMFVQPSAKYVPHPSKNVLIIDLGSSSVRAGLLGQRPTLPQLFFPCICATQKQTSEKIFGIEALQPHVRAMSTLSHPVRAKAKIHKFSVDVQSFPGLFRKIFTDLKVNAKTAKVLISMPQSFSRSTREVILQILFEQFGVLGVNMQHQSALALHAYNTTSGIMVDIGDRLDVVPITDGYMVDGGVTRLLWGGHLMGDYLRNMLAEKNVMLNSTVESYIIRYIMEESCYFAQDVQMEYKKLQTDPDEIMTVVDLRPFKTEGIKEEVPMDHARFSCTEGLFDPILWGIDNVGLHRLVHKAITACSMDTRKEMCRNILLAGGVTLMPGLAERLEAEVQKLVPGKLVVQVHSSPYRYHAAYIGACVFSSKQEFDDSCVSRDDWRSSREQCLNKWTNY